MLDSLGTDLRRGLSSREIPLKKKLFGENQLEEFRTTPPLAIFLNQFKDTITLVLLGATLISVYLGEIADAVAITAIVILNGIMGFVQEYRTEKSLKALREMTAPAARVLRDGEVKVIPARDVVPGDVVLLESGDVVPADGELFEAENLKIDESVLTGESVPVEKSAESRDQEGLKIHRANLAFMGTMVVSGRGKMLVTQIGMSTEMGKIAGMIGGIEEEQTPLQKRLDHLGKQLVVICLAICVIVALLGVIRGENLYDMFLFGVSLAVAAIPEGLPAVVTMVLTLGVQRMVKKNVLIRKLTAVETLGCATVICSDKTGTLTENRMTVRKIYVDDGVLTVTGSGYRLEGDFVTQEGRLLRDLPPGLKKLLEISVSCNNAELNEPKAGLLGKFLKSREVIPSGDPTEVALLVAAAKADIRKSDVERSYKRFREIPFDSERRCMSVLVKSGRGELFLFTKGAVDVVLGLCDRIEVNGKLREITDADKKKITEINEDMGREALRVLAVAYKKVNLSQAADANLERDLIFVGLTGMIDPPRPEVVGAVEKCFAAGIRPVMITGDHRATAWAVARELNIMGKGGRILTGQELDDMSETEFLNCVDDVSVYARVTPRHKLRIVRALKKKGHVVAMTGDGVNDAPAVKEADIGISMGRSGTDVTKEASAMILMDDNFASIVAAVEEGRIIYDNIRKFIRYLLSCNTGEVLTMVWASLLRLPLPLLPIQVLWMNLITDGLPAIALGADPPERDVMSRRPRQKNESIFSRGMGRRIFYRGFLISLATITAYLISRYYGRGDLSFSRTVAFCTLIMSQLIFAFECRSESAAVWEQNPFSNLYLTLAVVCSAAMLFGVVYIPGLQVIFHTVPLTKEVWLLILALSGLGAIL
ncbi:cation-translocating P-type ATPase [Thermosediminibacter litoriperuensis]|uniref:Ca2+-transporting ATPase n=1 Tax=Thermosediminibacter litoriperuensis TaxID=291989 RepID=A0A5S5AWF6_9FIRM|nr:cation-translocating P-type ATPase [Thermosediminibacter litoriperuensis]TYP56725.1 Ca2+-transporting ATPase [Thermosediminibacter litoriperuensis]